MIFWEEANIKMFARHSTIVVLSIFFLGLLGVVSVADPATPESERVARYGSWSVVKKPATYVIAETGQRGRYYLCSAALFAQNASLEFEAKNDKAWSVYVAAKGWNYRGGVKGLTLKSGSQEISIAQAMYGGPMISATSHVLGGKQIGMNVLKALIAQSQPIAIHDSSGRKLVTFPNTGSGLQNAFARVIQCSKSSQP